MGTWLKMVTTSRSIFLEEEGRRKMGDLFENGPNWDFSERGEDGSGGLSRKCSRLVKRYSRGGGVGDLVENVQDWLNDILGEGEWGS